MNGYIQYKCNHCKKIFILSAEEVTHSEKESTYLTCPYNGKHASINVVERYGNYKELMETQRIYRRKNRAVHQVKIDG